MNIKLRLISAAVLAVMPGVALAQADAHHPDAGSGATPPAAVAPAPAPAGQPADPAQMMQMMQMMMQMMPMMQQMMSMMQGTMSQGMAPGDMGKMPMAGVQMSDANKAYMSAMAMMNAPMMMGAQSSDPDVAFIKAMIPHHEGAITMAKAVLQYGKDDKVKAWANQIIKAEEAEVADMKGWLKEHGQ